MLVADLFQFLNSPLPWRLFMGSLLTDQCFYCCWIFCAIRCGISTFCCRRSFSAFWYELGLCDSRKSAREWSVLLLKDETSVSLCKSCACANRWSNISATSCSSLWLHLQQLHLLLLHDSQQICQPRFLTRRPLHIHRSGEIPCARRHW